MSTLNVLLVTYLFPPVGGTGVMRATSLARHFPKEGIHLDVLTTRNPASVGSDNALLAEISREVGVHRTLTPDLPFGFKKGLKRLIAGKAAPAKKASTTGASGRPPLAKRLVQDLLLPDPQVTWLPVLKRAARRIVRKNRIDVVLVTVPPFSCLFLIEDLRKRFPELPIVVDFRDEWLSTSFDLVSFLFSGSERARRLARKVEAAAVENATAVVAVTEAARLEIHARYPEQPESKFQLIPNGFEPGRLQQPSLRPGSGDTIVVSHVGTVYASTAPTELVEALRQLPPEVKSRFRLRFIGYIEEQRFRDALLELGEMVELRGFMPQREALATMNETDYVLLINHDPLNVGGKFYDYVGSGKPILGAVHAQGETRRLLEDLRAGWWADIHNVEAIRQLFLDAAARGKPPLPGFNPDKEKIARYERKALAQRYAALLRSIAESARKGEPAINHAARAGTGS